MKLSRRTRRRIKKSWPIAGLGALAVVTAVMVGAALTPPSPAPTSTFTPAVIPEPTFAARPVTAAFLGDSYTAGNGAADQTRRWSSLLSTAEGWTEYNFGFGGTNYATGGDLPGGRSYLERVDEVIAKDPDAVIVSSAGNTLRVVDQSEGISATFTALREGLPGARIVALSPFLRPGQDADLVTQFGEDIKASVEAVGGTYVSIGAPLVDSSGVLDKDAVHPNGLGHELLAEAVKNALPPLAAD